MQATSPRFLPGVIAWISRSRRKADVSNALSRQAKFFAFHIAFGYSTACIKSWVDAQANLPLPGKVDRESGCGS